jgi:D-arabinose 1-dehydrogenase-like Zn-dependent alcohol dehydrogenase
VGSSMGTLAEFRRMVRFCASEGIGPVIDSTWPLPRAKEAIARMAEGKSFGKVVLDCSAH